MIKSTERLENGKMKLEIVVDADAFEKAQQAAYRKMVGRMSVPGFRKGKAPRKMLEKMYGESVFYEEAVGGSYPEAFEAAIDETDLEPVERAGIEVQEVDADGYTFTATFAVRPEAKIGQYKGLRAYKPALVITDDEVNAELDKTRERNARIVSVERAIQNGDSVVFDFEGFVDEVPFEGGKAEKYELKIGSGQFIPGFEEQMVGLNIGDEADVQVSFPDEYHAEHLAGKPAVFKVRIHEVKESQLPELDDDFAQDVSEFNTLDEFKNSIRDRLTHAREHEVDNVFEDSLLDTLAVGMEVEIPEAMIDSQLDQIVQDFANRLSYQGLSLDTYLQMIGGSIDDILAEYRPVAKRVVQSSLAYEAVAKAEGMTVSDEDLQAEYQHVSERYNVPVAEVEEKLDKKQVVRDILLKRALDFVKENAIIDDKPPVDVSVSVPEAPEADAVVSDGQAEQKPTKKSAKKPAKDAEAGDAEPKAPKKSKKTKEEE